jgi:tetratricopeptide (TPR) repeat protein
MIRRGVRWIVVATAALATGAACGRNPQMVDWERDLYYTEKLYVDGQFELASARFAKLRANAARPEDADEAGFEQCETLARAKQRPEAMACYDALATTGALRDHRMRALLYAGELRFDAPATRRQSLRIFAALIRNAADTAAGLRAIDFLTIHGKENALQRDEVLKLFAQLERESPQSEVADNLLLRGALLLEPVQTPETDAAALALLEKNERAHPDAGTLMDTLELHARILQRLGRLREEAEVWQRVVETYETSYVFASYVTAAHRAGFDRLIALFRGPLNDLAKAETYARRLPEVLHHPLELPKYYLQVAEIQEARGDFDGAIATARELEEAMRKRWQKMRANDERICDDADAGARREACLSEVRAAEPVVTTAEVKLRELATRLAARGRP